ncbi:nSTAND1 domain-containing NTPase [Sinosporangium siamense]|nr:helix-turn-helix domain-containing protein [Sinosporangium siamense]
MGESRDSTGAGARLRRLRVERGLSLGEMSRLTHYSKGYLSKIETDDKALTPGVARRCDEVLETGGELADLVASAADECPYVGLSAYEQAHARWFFGRERAVSMLVARLAERSAARANGRSAGHGPIVVVAPSGAGKSSLLRAGLLPAVRRGALPAPESRTWPVTVFTPGEHPAAELSAQVGALAGLDVPSLSATLAEDPGLFAARVRTALHEWGRPGEAQGHGRRLLLVADQFEEIFTLCRDPGERHAFLAALHALTRPPHSTALVVLGLRADFYCRCLSHPELVESLRDGQFPLGPMTRAELLDVINGPARAAGLRLEPGLAELLLRDMGVFPTGDRTDNAAGVSYEPGALPLLSHALLTTWQRRSGDTLTVEGYQLTDGIVGAVASSAERVFTRLAPAHQEIARLMLLRMVCVGEDDTETGRPVSICDLPPSHFPPPATGEVVEAFTHARLLTVSADHLRLSHEALLWAWPRLREWIRADRAGLRTHRTLSEAALSWEREDRDPSLLYRGTRLQATVEWAGTGTGVLSGSEHAFLDAGLAAWAAEEEAARRRARRRRLLAGALAGLLAMSGAATAFAVLAQRATERQRGLASSQRAESLSRGLAARSVLVTGDPAAAARLATTAWRLAPTGEAHASMAMLLGRPDRAVMSGLSSTLAFSSDSRVLMGAGKDGTLRLWDTARHQALGESRAGRGPLSAAAFSPDGRLLAGAGPEGAVRVWEVAARVPVAATLGGHTGVVRALAFGPDGRVLATASKSSVRLWDVATLRPVGELAGGRAVPIAHVVFSGDGNTVAAVGASAVRVWDVAARRPLGGTLRHEGGAPSAAAFSPDGRVLAVAAKDSVRLWDVAEGRALGSPLAGYNGVVRSLAFSPDGGTLATADDASVRLWDVAARRPLGWAYTGHTDWLTSVVFSPDGRMLASAASDGTVRLWDVTAHGPAGTILRGHKGWVYSAVFGPDGRTLASGASDKTVRLWDVAGRRPLGPPLTGHRGSVASVAVSSDGRTLASGSVDKTVRLWDLTDRRPLGRPLTGHRGAVFPVAFSPDGRTLASGDATGEMRMWDIAGRRAVGAPLKLGNGPVASVAYSPDGRTLAAGTADGTIHLWDAATLRPLGAPLPAHHGMVFTVVFSPDSRTLAGAGQDGTVRLWDVRRRTPLGDPLTGHHGMVFAVAFSPDGRFLASGAVDGTVRLWETAGGRSVGAPLTSPHGPVFTVAFSPDGHTLVSGSGDGDVRLRRTALPDDLFTALCAVAGRSLTPEEWRRQAPGAAYRPVCP